LELHPMVMISLDCIGEMQPLAQVNLI